MTEAKKTKSTGRLLNYQMTNESEKLSAFVKRIKEQVEVLKLGIKQGSINDPKICEKYIKKIDRFLNTPFFIGKQLANKRLGELKKELKISVAEYKALISIIQEWIDRKRNLKIVLANTFTFADGKFQGFYYPYEIENYYNRDLEYLYGIVPNYKSELILHNKLLGILADDKFLECIGCKNSWKVETLKENLAEWAKDYPFEVEFELEEIFALPYFKQKKFKEMDVRELREVVTIRVKVLEKIIGWIEQEIKDVNERREKAMWDKEKTVGYNIHQLYSVYDNFIEKYSTIKKSYEEQYSLYRFGQGLIEADLFETLYK